MSMNGEDSYTYGENNPYTKIKEKNDDDAFRIKIVDNK